MKKIFLFFLLGSLFQIASGQNEKPISRGNFLAGGSFSFDISKAKEYEPLTGTKPGLLNNIMDRKELRNGLNFGYFLINQFAFGLKVEIFNLFNKTTFPNDTPSISKNFNRNLAIGPFIRYYTKPGIFFDGSVNIVYMKFKSDDYVKKWKEYSWCIGIGYSIFISKSISIEPEISYTHMNIPNLGISKNSLISSGLSFSSGLKVYFNPKKKLINE